MNIQEGIQQVTSNRNLEQDQMFAITTQILEGRTTDAQIGAFIIALSMKGETVDEVLGAVNDNFVDFWHEIAVHGPQLDTYGSFQILSGDWHLEVMRVLSTVDVEALLVGLVGHTVPDLGPEHHLVAGHEINNSII